MLYNNYILILIDINMYIQRIYNYLKKIEGYKKNYDYQSIDYLFSKCFYNRLKCREMVNLYIYIFI